MLSRKHIIAQEDITPFADENVDDLGDVSDEFSELFFEALKQKGIENYERAITALEECIVLEPQKGILYFEKGKNEFALKNYNEAAVSFTKALDFDANQADVLQALFDNYEQAKEYDNAITTGLRLAAIESDKREGLARVYIANKDLEKGLDLLDVIDQEKGSDPARDLLRRRAYRGKTGEALKRRRLEGKLASNTATITDLEQLIYIYLEEEANDKAVLVVQSLEKMDKTNPLIEIASYKQYLQSERIEEAITSMQLGLREATIPTTVKRTFLKDYIALAKDNPSYQEGFENSVSAIQANGQTSSLYRMISDYYNQKKKIEVTATNTTKNDSSLKFLEKALAADPENLELITKVTKAQLEAQDQEGALKTTSNALELFPSQPQLYLDQALAFLGLGQNDNAIESLELGIDYIIENNKLEAQYYAVWAAVYKAKGDTSNYNKYLQRSKSLKSRG